MSADQHPSGQRQVSQAGSDISARPPSEANAPEASLLSTVREGLSASVPFANHVGLTYDDVSAQGSATVTLPEREHSRNHVGAVRAGALFTAAETASGAAVTAAFAARIGRLRPLVRTASITYLVLARGDTTARARITRPLAELTGELDRDGRTRFTVTVTLHDPGEVVVAEAEVQWDIRDLTSPARSHPPGASPAPTPGRGHDDGPVARR